MARRLEGRGGAQVSVAGVARQERELDLFERPDGALSVVTYGSVLRWHALRWSRWEAAYVAAAYARHGLAGLSDLDGSFQLAIIDVAARRVHLLSDRMGSVPLFWARTATALAFAPEGLTALDLLGLPARVDPLGAFEFLNQGYPMGARTLLAGVQRLQPGHVLTYDLERGAHHLAPWWRLAFHPDPKLSERTAAAALCGAVVQAQDAVPLTAARRVAVALTGGYDSRIVLGTLATVPSAQYSAVSWGEREDLPRSDPYIARQLAELCRVPHRFHPYAADDFARHVGDWCARSECLSDNLGLYAAGAQLLAGGTEPPDLVLTGDHLIGLAGAPANLAQAVYAVTQSPMDGMATAMVPLLRGDACATLAAAYRQELDAMVATATGSDLRDIQDHLFQQILAPAWLFAPAFYREPMCSGLRPLLLAPVLEVMAQTPRALRSDKAVLVRMLRDHLPRLAAVPKTSAFSLIDWPHAAHQEPSLRAWLEARCSAAALDGTVAGELLAAESVVAALRRFWQTPVAPQSRRPTSVHALVNARRWAAQRPLGAKLLPTAERWFRRLVRGPGYTRSTDVPFRALFRVALLAELDAFLRDHRARSAQGPVPPPPDATAELRL